MNPKISIIVPVYKVERYLEKCINSILNQTFKDFELILVDDGSPDRCGEICDNYAKKDNRIIVIHKENGGVSDARNVGLDIATGEYIGFVDSDDWIEKDMYENLYDKCKKEQSDIGIIGVHELSEYDNYTYEYIPVKEEFLSILKRAHVWNKIFKKELFLKNSFRFKKGTAYEDLELVPKLFMNSRKVSIISSVGYYYLQRQDSIVHQKDSKIILDFLLAYLSLQDYIMCNKFFKEKYIKDFYSGLEFFSRFYIEILSRCSLLFIFKNSLFFLKGFSKLKILNFKNFFYLIYLKCTGYKHKKILERTCRGS